MKMPVKAVRGPFRSTAAMSRGVVCALSKIEWRVKKHAIWVVPRIFHFRPIFGAEVFFIWCKRLKLYMKRNRT